MAGTAQDRVSLDAWRRLWSRIGARSDPQPIHQEVRHAYGEPHRYYHTLEHVRRVLELADGVRHRLIRPDETELALWLHDVIYDPQASDNEARSAAYAQDILQEGRVDRPVGERVAALIMATRHLAAPEDPDARYMIDVDLSILGTPEPEFDRFDAQVRREYAFRSDAEWRQGRRRVLQAFLDRPMIFQTAEFAHCEGPARANLKRAIERLTAIPLPPRS
jgi:predicted metal-dependent HD superfamily phosphohydrolase